MKRKSVRYSDPVPASTKESDPFDLDEHAYDDYADEPAEARDDQSAAKRDDA